MTLYIFEKYAAFVNVIFSGGRISMAAVRKYSLASGMTIITNKNVGCRHLKFRMVINHEHTTYLPITYKILFISQRSFEVICHKLNADRTCRLSDTFFTKIKLIIVIERRDIKSLQ
jgi:hypothetical protein